MTNVFLIPSWYPNKLEPMSGIFTKEQSLLIGESGRVKYIVSIIERYPLTPKRPILFVKNLIGYLFDKKRLMQINANYTEHFTPALIWSKKLLNGNLKNLYAIHRANLVKGLKTHRIDLIHAHVSYPAGYFAYLLSKEFKIPYMITEHMSPFPFASLLHNNTPIDEIKVALNNSRCNVAVSRSLQNEITGFGFKKPLVIPNFIDEERYETCDTVVDQGHYTFLTVGNITPQKGIDLLIQAVALLKQEINIQKLIFKIVGEGDYKKVYQKLIDEYGLEKNIRFIGYLDREAVLKEFQTCDAFVLASRHESFGVVYIEALACGKPVIATRCGGPETIVVDKVGVLVEKDDPQALKEAIKQFYLKEKIYDSQEIREYFLDNFSKSVNVNKYLELYEEVKNVRN